MCASPVVVVEGLVVFLADGHQPWLAFFQEKTLVRVCGQLGREALQQDSAICHAAYLSLCSLSVEL